MLYPRLYLILIYVDDNDPEDDDGDADDADDEYNGRPTMFIYILIYIVFGARVVLLGVCNERTSIASTNMRCEICQRINNSVGICTAHTHAANIT